MSNKKDSKKYWNQRWNKAQRTKVKEYLKTGKFERVAKLPRNRHQVLWDWY